jgi:hypothetical protein
MLFQLLSTSLLYLPPGTNIEKSLESAPLELSQKYHDAGVEIMYLLGSQGTTLVGVQHDLLRAAWLKNRGRGAEAWHALSNSVRHVSVTSITIVAGLYELEKLKISICIDGAKLSRTHRK